jgi:hypothetical protein
VIFELRQYTLKPGARETLVEMFERDFLESQEVLGAYVVGQFRDLDRPDYFVWIRSFADMPSRLRALTDFYSGPVWQAGRAAANATMIDTDDVYLLRGDEISIPREDIEVAGSTVILLIASMAPTADGADFANADIALAPITGLPGVRHFGSLRTEHAVNDYPALPVREGENVIVILLAYDGTEPPPGFEAARAEASRQMAAPMRQLRLEPTRRSRMR